MQYKLHLIAVFLLWVISTINSYGQANSTLSNLQSPTAVNQSLQPSTDSTYDLGSRSRAWRSLFLHNRLYLRNILTIHTSGVFSFFAGTDAGNTTMTGDVNTGIGTYALFKNKTGDHNTALGYLALGYNINGYSNTAIGAGSLSFNKEGYYNTAIGQGSLSSNTNGNGNTAGGLSSLLYNTTGNWNTATGAFSLSHNTIGQSNTAYGAYVLSFNTEGSSNTASGYASLRNNSTGSYNTTNGEVTLITNREGNFNSALGYFADVTTEDLNNATAIGAGSKVDASNKVRIGNTEVTSIGGQVGWTTFSDGRFKRNIQENIPGLVFINSLRPVSYTVDLQRLNAYYNRGNNVFADSVEKKFNSLQQKSLETAANILRDGFVAQEVEAAANKAGFAFSGVDKPSTKDGLYGLRYDHFVVPLVKAVQELSSMNDTLRKENEILRKEMNELKAMVLAIISNKNQLITANSK